MNSPSVAALYEVERAASRAPSDAQLRHAALVALMRARVGDDDIGAAMSMGGERTLQVGVVTPYFREDIATLRRCHASVLGQTYPCRHIMVADGWPQSEIDAWHVEHVRLSRAHADYGDTPRVAGGARALELGCDAIAYLDADNVYRTHHVESLVYRQRETGAPVVFAGRTMHFPDGELLPLVDPEDCVSHIDTSCLFLAGSATPMHSAWLTYPRQLAVLDDRLFIRMLRARGLAFAFTGALTLRYTIHYAAAYLAQGRPVPPTARPPLDFAPALRYCRNLRPEQRRELDVALGFSLETVLRDLCPPLHPRNG